MTTDSVRGVKVRGEHPEFLLLSDGSALVLDSEGCRGHGADWRLIAANGQVERDCICAREALELAGDEFARYIAVRTRAEVEWLHVVAAWCREEANALARDFEQATPDRSDAGRRLEHHAVADHLGADHLLIGEGAHHRIAG
jgi:hypothetical protein